MNYILFTDLRIFGIHMFSIISSQIYPNSGINHTVNYPDTAILENYKYDPRICKNNDYN